MIKLTHASDRWAAYIAEYAAASVSVKRDGDITEIGLYGPVGASWSGDGLTEDGVLASVPSKTKSLRARVRSPGGDPWVAMAIGGALRDRAEHITMIVDGVAASAASLLLMYADAVEVTDGAQIMVHAPWTIVAGDAKELRECADLCDKLSASMAEIYARRVGEQEAARIVDAATGETWYSAQEAVDAGLADRVIKIKKREKKDEPKRDAKARLRIAAARSKV